MSTSVPATAAHPERAALRRSISNTLKGSAGNLVEWYDVYVYSVFAVYFESQFFSAADKNSTMYVWAIFAATFQRQPDPEIGGPPDHVHQQQRQDAQAAAGSGRRGVR